MCDSLHMYEHGTINMTDGVHMGIGMYIGRSQEEMNSS